MVPVRKLFATLYVQTHAPAQSQGEHHAHRASPRRASGAFVPGWPRHKARRSLITGFLIVSLIMTSCLYGCEQVKKTVGETPMAKDAGLAAVVCGGAGAIAGAALGAALAKTNKPWWTLVSTLFGAGVSAATCYAVVQATDTPVEECQATKARVKYQSTQGTVVRIETFEVEPATLSPGQNFTMRSRYLVLTPASAADLTVVETNSVGYYDDKDNNKLKEVPFTENKTIKCGTRERTFVPQVPPDAGGGRRLLAFKVESNGVADQKSQERTIVKAQASLPTALRHEVFTMQHGDARSARAR